MTEIGPEDDFIVQSPRSARQARRSSVSTHAFACPWILAERGAHGCFRGQESTDTAVITPWPLPFPEQRELDAEALAHACLLNHMLHLLRLPPREFGAWRGQGRCPGKHVDSSRDRGLDERTITHLPEG